MARLRTSGWLALAMMTLGDGDAHGEEWLEREDVIAFLDEVQALSLRTGREYCGYFVWKDDEIVATPPKRGKAYECLSAEPRGDVEVIASYHSHGGFEPDADSEVPSVDDILSDREEGVDGYLVTPGGRVWFHDLESGDILLLCAGGCVTADPDHDDAYFAPIKPRYRLWELRDRFDSE